MPQERPAATTLKGNPFTLVGPELKAGDKASGFYSSWHRFERGQFGQHRGKSEAHQRSAVPGYASLRRPDTAV